MKRLLSCAFTIAVFFCVLCAPMRGAFAQAGAQQGPAPAKSQQANPPCICSPATAVVSGPTGQLNMYSCVCGLNQCVVTTSLNNPPAFSMQCLPAIPSGTR